MRQLYGREILHTFVCSENGEKQQQCDGKKIIILDCEILEHLA